MIYELVMMVVSLPFHLWCHLRHRRYWYINASGWGWACRVDGFEHGFSKNDVRRMMK